MRVSRLEIFGFKSFVEPFVLTFDEALIGIVGPNGCGKSNVVDALRWVLGETQARQLRGGTFEDLIFSGSETRRPLGMAEVSITIRPHEGWASNLSEKLSIVQEGDLNDLLEKAGEPALYTEPDGAEQVAVGRAPEVPRNGVHFAVPASILDIPGIFDATEIQLMRRLYRSGESEYFINRTPCRLRDMLDIYRVLGLGARGLSIVAQGQIGQFISKKPVERRELLEEAAGISGFRTRVEAAQRKLERTSQNMLRLRDISAEVEKQVRVLKRQANRAKNRNELKESLSRAEKNLFTVRSGKILIKKKELARERDTAVEKLAAAESTQSVADARQEELRAQLQIVDVELVELRRKREDVFQLITRERERIQAVQLELTRLDGRAKHVQSEIFHIDTRTSVIVGEEVGYSGQITGKETELTELEQRRLEEEAALVVVQQSRSEEEGSAAAIAEIDATLGNLIIKREELSKVLAVYDEGIPARISEKEGSIALLEHDLRTLQEKSQRNQLALAGRESEKAALESHLNDLAARVGRLTSGSQAETVDSHAPGKAIASVIRVQPDFQKAVAAVLGEQMHFVISDNAAGLGRNFCEQFSNGPSTENIRIGVIDKFAEEATAARLTPAELELVPQARLLLDFINVDSEYRSSLRALLADLVVVPRLDDAFRLKQFSKENGFPVPTFVTLRGEVVTAWGWYSTQGEGIGVSFGRRIGELSAEISEFEDLVSGDSRQLKSMVAELDAAKVLLADLVRHQETVREEAASLQRQISSLTEEERLLERRRNDVILERERRAHAIHLERERSARERLQEVLLQLARVRSFLEYAEKQLQSFDSEKSALSERRYALVQEEEILRVEQLRVEEELRENVRRANEAHEHERSEEKLGRFEQAVKGLERRREELSTELSSVMQDLNGWRRETQKSSEALNRIQLSLEKCDLELGMLVEDFQRYYGKIDSEENSGLASEAVLQALLAEAEGDADTLQRELQEEAQGLRQRIDREGEVDPQSIELYEIEQKRLDDMKTQLEDLEAAVAILEKTIRQLKDISRSRFLDTFDVVNKNFKELVPRLFGGGAGHLELLNPEDPLESGVEIALRPPGKKISTMELLSGGEKALVATAVLMSMFLYRPGPICVLDEVDAPLDDANLERFLELLREISERTQFLIITHNKLTMQAANRLVGISMQEKGISTALSVSFGSLDEDFQPIAANA